MNTAMGDSRNEPPLKIPTVKETIGRHAEKYKKRTTHRNQLTAEESKSFIERKLKENTKKTRIK
jgi:hypothetical protein